MGKIRSLVSRLAPLFPANLKMLIKATFGKAEIIGYPVQKELELNCPICEKQVYGFNLINTSYLKNFDRYQFPYSPYMFETLNAFAYTCPKCGCGDRERLYGLFLRNNLFYDKMTAFSMVDFAPSKAFSNFVKTSFPNVAYRSADLIRDYVDDKIDITNMNQYQDGQFDVFICSHILEHVKEDKVAIKELFRILKNEGIGVIMVPIMLSIDEDYENEKILSEAERWKHFGQGDHVRLYSKAGFIKKLEEQEFVVNQFGIDYFGKHQFSRHGIHPRSILYVVQKRIDQDSEVAQNCN